MLRARTPYQFRKLLGKDPKRLAVLDAEAQKAGWDKPAPQGVSRGIALVEAYGTLCAEIAEVSVRDKGPGGVHKVVAAVDTGHVLPTWRSSPRKSIGASATSVP